MSLEVKALFRMERVLNAGLACRMPGIREENRFLQQLTNKKCACGNV